MIGSGFVLRAAAVATVFYFAYLFYDRFTEQAIEIDPISVPKDLDERGYTPTVVADRLRDEIAGAIASLKPYKGGEEIGLKGEDPDITVPSVGLSVEAIVASVSSHFHRNNVQEVWGDVVHRNGKVVLTLRVRPGGVLGVFATQTGDPDALFAGAALKIIERTEPYYFGMLLNARGKRSYARSYFEEEISRDPTVADTHLGLASVLLGERNLPEAEFEEREAIRLDPRDALKHNNLGVILEFEKKSQEAEDQFREAIRLDPTYVRPRNNLVLVLLQDKNFAQAEAESRAELHLNPYSADMHSLLGMVLSGEGDLPNSEAEFREAVELSPEDVLAHNNLGTILSREGKLKQAEAEYRASIRLDPNGRLARDNLAIVLRNEGMRR